MSTTSKPETTAASTDVAEFISDLDGGQFERKLSIALSQVAAAVVDHGKKGEVKITMSIKKIDGTHQVVIDHAIKFERPTSSGKAGEEDKRATVLHVGKYGALSLAQPSLLDEKQSKIAGV
jgi:hypothetical protein